MSIVQELMTVRELVRELAGSPIHVLGVRVEPGSMDVLLVL